MCLIAHSIYMLICVTMKKVALPNQCPSHVNKEYGIQASRPVHIKHYYSFEHSIVSGSLYIRCVTYTTPKE